MADPVENNARVMFTDNEQAAQAVYKHILAAQPPLRHLTLRLYNPDHVKFSDWWLVPSRTWPPHPHSRLLFRQSRVTSGAMFAGFHIAKGLGRQLPGIVSDDVMMTPQWYWHEFLNEVQGGVFDGVLRDVGQRTGLPVVVRLELSELSHVPDVTGYRPQIVDDALEFTVREAGGSLERVEAARNILAPLNEAQHLRDLVWPIIGLRNPTWYWIDWLMGVRVDYGAPDVEGWGAAELWHNALEPWLRWVR